MDKIDKANSGLECYAGTNTFAAIACFFGVYRHLLKYAGVLPVPLLLVAKAPMIVPASHRQIRIQGSRLDLPVKGPLPPDTISALAMPILTASLGLVTGAAENTYLESSVASMLRRRGSLRHVFDKGTERASGAV